MPIAAPVQLCVLFVATPASRGAPLQLPLSARAVFLNIGSHTSPVLPPNNTVVAIAYEPIVHASIAPSAGLYVVPVAVSVRSGFAMMGVHGRYGSKASSSLSTPNERMRLNVGRDDPSTIVPVASMSSVLASIPASVDLWFLKTDMQGEDARAVKSSGTLIRRAHYIMAEVTLRGVASYDGAQNDYCNNWLPHMLAQGFVPDGIDHHPFRGAKGANRFCANESSIVLSHRGIYETNAYWIRNTTRMPIPDTEHWMYRRRKQSSIPRFKGSREG